MAQLTENSVKFFLRQNVTGILKLYGPIKIYSDREICLFGVLDMGDSQLGADSARSPRRLFLKSPSKISGQFFGCKFYFMLKPK